jgi:ubiquinone/menaquinone biosynthesis C-methylase UbiE
VVQPLSADGAAAGTGTGPVSAAVDVDAFNRFEAEGWEARAGSYQFLRPVTARSISTLLAAVAAGPGRQLLDVGCGPGDLAAAAAAAGADAAGIDVAPSMVRRAALANPSIPFRLGSFEAIPGRDAAFDALAGNFVFNHVGRPELALAEARRVLRPGGLIALSSWDAPGRNRVLGLFLDAVVHASAPAPEGVPVGPTNFRADEELRGLLSAAGFEAVATQRIMFEASVPSLDVLWSGVLDSAVRIPPSITRQPADVQARIRAAFDQLAQVHRRADGSFAIPVSVQIVQGRRP